MGAIQRDLLQREIREGDRLGEDRVAVAVLAGEGGAAVGMHPEPPELERFGGDALVIALREGDVIEQPVRSALLGDIFRTVRIQDLAHEGMAVPCLGAGELPQVVGGEGFFRVGHD